MKTKFVKTTLSLSLLLMAAAPTAAFAGTNCNANVSVPLNQSVVKNLNSNFVNQSLQDCLKSQNFSNLNIKCENGKVQFVKNGSQEQVEAQKSNCSKANTGTTTTKPTTTKSNTTTTKPTTTNSNTTTTKPATTNTNTTTTKPATTNTTTGNSANAVGSYEQQVVNIVNQERAKEGLAPLTLNAKLSNVAETKAEDMRDKNYFSHTSPTYGSPFDMMKQFGITYTAAGENIAKGQKTPQDVMTAWMNSSGHRANIMNSNYQQIGVGYVTDSNGTTYWVQEFIK
nr:CAP domain-containing protein [uncultured Aminipila sp.]